MYEPIPSDEAVELLSRVLEFRERDQRSTPTQESAELLALFPRVQVRQGYQLDFSQETTPSGVHQPILPFARPTGDDSWVPIFDGEVGREELVEQLYQYIEYEQTPAGLFEYAFFAIELWSLRPSTWPCRTRCEPPTCSAPPTSDRRHGGRRVAAGACAS
jgi:hypothetical protein